MQKIIEYICQHAGTRRNPYTHTDKPCQVKKQIGTICLMLISLFISPVFATEINNPATCDSGTLSTDTGPTNLRANYESNQLNLRFYDNNTLLDVSSTNSGTCTYGTPINLPTAPTKSGYTFKGWKVVPQYDFTNLNVYTDGFMRYSIGTDNGTNTCWKRRSENEQTTTLGNCDSEVYKDLQRNEFKGLFNFGTVYGMALCSNTSGTMNVAGTPNESVSGGHCWCKVTGYIQDGSSEKYVPLNIVPWVYWANLGGSQSGGCVTYCANSCSSAIVSDRIFRIVAYGQSGS